MLPPCFQFGFSEMRRARRGVCNIDDIFNGIVIGGVKALDVHLRNGGNMDITSSTGEGLLAAAIRGRDNELFRRCVVKGVRMRHPDNMWRTPLHVAVESGNLQAAEVLLVHGARIDPVDKNGNTPLLEAVRQKNCLMVDFLLSEEADVNFVNFHTRLIPLTAAVETGDLATLCLILSYFPKLSSESINRKGGSGYSVSIEATPLVQAMKRKDVEIFSKILDNNEKRQVRDCFIHEFNWALKHKLPAVKMLLKHGVELGSYAQHFVVRVAVATGDAILAKLLIQHFPLATCSSLQDNYLLRFLLGICCDGLSRICKKLIGHTQVHCRLTAALFHCGLSIHHFQVAAKDGKYDTCECKHWIQLKSTTNPENVYPVSLKSLCRTKIRSRLGTGLSSKVERLWLPDVLKDYLMFELEGLEYILNTKVPAHSLSINTWI